MGVNSGTKAQITPKFREAGSEDSSCIQKLVVMEKKSETQEEWQVCQAIDMGLPGYWQIREKLKMEKNHIYLISTSTVDRGCVRVCHAQMINSQINAQRITTRTLANIQQAEAVRQVEYGN